MSTTKTTNPQLRSGPKRKASKSKVKNNATKTLATEDVHLNNQLRALEKRVTGMIMKSPQAKASLHPVAVALIKQILHPSVKGKHQRWPDEFNLPTAILCSKTTIPILASKVGANPDNGRFFSLVAIPANPVFAQDGRSGFIYAKAVTTLGPSSAGAGAVIGLANTGISINKIASLKSNVAWSPGSTLDDAAWTFTPDSQTDELFGNFVAVAGLYGAGLDAGIVRTIRALGMSAWFRCSESAFQNGGDVAISRITSNLHGDIFPLNGPQTNPNAGLATWTTPGPLMNYENLLQLPTAYQGNLKDGAYAYWYPLTSPTLQPPALMGTTISGSGQPTNMEYLAVAGLAQPDTNGNFPSSIGFLEVNTIYEYTTANQFIEQKIEPFNPEALHQVTMFLSTLDSAMSNKGHMTWLKNIWKFLAGAGAAGITLATGGAAAPAIAAGLATAGAARAIFD